jgi:hypothetical protein
MNADVNTPQSGAGTRGGSQFRWPHLRRRTLWTLAVIVVLLGGGGAAAGLVVAGGGAGAGTWFQPGSPKLQVNVAGGCPRSLGNFQDVVNTFPGPPLVPTRPGDALICRYGPIYGVGPTPATQRLLVTSTRLHEAQAQQLATAIRSISLTATVGGFSCPADLGEIAVIELAYSGRPGVGLWYRTTGCQTLDNGRIGAYEGGNPSFYNRFENLIDRVSPPVELQNP